jgi:hypothetical protein
MPGQVSARRSSMLSAEGSMGVPTFSRKGHVADAAVYGELNATVCCARQSG